MDMKRVGNYRDRGTRTFFENRRIEERNAEARLEWEPYSKKFVIKCRGVPHTDGGKTHHEWEIRLTIADQIEILAKLCHVIAPSDASILAGKFSQDDVGLLRLLAYSKGYLLPPIVDQNKGGLVFGIRPA